MSEQPTSNDQLPGEPLVSVTLTGEEFKKLTDEMAETDRINGESVKRIMDLEHVNSILVARIDRLRKRIGKAVDALTAAPEPRDG